MSRNTWRFKTGGIPDDLFIRAQVPMTKAEVRAVTIAKARLNDNDVIWDIGAGTGSISVEAALTAVTGTVYAVEKEPDAVELIRRNIELFGTGNIKVCPGTAPEKLYDLPEPDRVFIGGSGGNLAEIINYAYQKMTAGGRLVVNAVVLETLSTAVEAMKQAGLADLDISQVAVAKAVEVGKLHMFKSHNPVFIISGEKRQSERSLV
ncbi:MAG: precorrin-6Y C5,15-methyltransferase (decarboxylating) subunit CbiT [Thermincola sp.]|jgi:cobalt-precorrin-6B (C15)-methyltransferase|nr:precorrin-6Y C5,15-methyltransferase (decarboxylating) subunit CbiT [Thermincola sp.]MDT3703592.1 precorrin-6Y C5,15-methyltransferase (decarboxylating) subunit CbiT [Thermincola sp.]